MHRRFTRRSNAFSKSLQHHEAAVALHFFYYNFIRTHQTLRVTPAVEANVTNKLWNWSDLLNWKQERISAYSQERFHMKYTVQHDFIKRTLNILEHYDDITKYYLEEYKSEATLFVNCLMGLLIITDEKYIHLCVKKREESICVFTKTRQAFFLNKENVEHLRDSVAHYDVKLKSNPPKERIEGIEFTFKNRNGEVREVVEFELVAFKPAIIEFANRLLKIIENEVMSGNKLL